jgi:hypothetical protein
MFLFRRLLTNFTALPIEPVELVRMPARSSFEPKCLRGILSKIDVFSGTLLTLLFLYNPFETVKSVRMLSSLTHSSGRIPENEYSPHTT